MNVMDAMTDKERNIYNAICLMRKRKDDEQLKILKENIQKEIKLFSGIRNIQKEFLFYSNIQKDGTKKYTENISRQIVIFENEITRRCDKRDDDLPLIKEMMIIRCKSDLMSGILRQIVENGIVIDDTEYIFYTSSTGQMKECEITIVSKKFWETNQESLMCGLSTNIINESGGINTGKFLSALALNMSNSVEIACDVNIDDVIIVPDFKTVICDEVNYLDVDKLTISQQKKNIEIEHMDGAGIFMPGTLPCSCQIRGGWLKGAVFPFDFHAFIKENKGNLSKKNMIDAWGNPLTEDEFLKAKVILTDSQLKMRKYYKSLKDYRKKFKQSSCKITINNVAHSTDIENITPEVRVAYQPLQTIPRLNIDDKAIKRLTEKTISYINGAKTDTKMALKLMGIDEAFINKCNPLFKAISKYPKMLNDIHVKKIMKNALKAERKKAMGGKIILNGIWSYVCPDLYAFCEWLFCGEENPKGLVKKGYIYNQYYFNKDDIKEVCCIRYPHLSDCEHAIRKVEKSDKCMEWFSGTDMVVSCHDLISKVLQCDWDGDHICVIHDKAFLDVLDKNKLPLYYEMEKAQPSEINTNNIIDCLYRSFTNENIGFVSNAITKILNRQEEPDINFIRILCAYNNYVIDYFKTQKSMDLKNYKEKYIQLKDNSEKLPYFFIYAKNKKRKNCDPYSEESIINRISKYIANATKDGITKYMQGDNMEFNPKMLMSCSDKIDRSSEEYNNLRMLLSELKIRSKKRYAVLLKSIKIDLNVKISSDLLFYYDCRKQIGSIINDMDKAVDYLIDIEYYQPENSKDNKNILWGCYGEILYNNLLLNIGKIQNDKTKCKRNDKTKCKRKAYQSRNLQLEEIHQLVACEKEKQDKIKQIPITVNLNAYIVNDKKIKNDRLLFYILYVLVKRADAQYGSNYVRLYKRNKSKLTRQTICSWMGLKSINTQLNRLKESEEIRIEEHRNFFKISIPAVKNKNMDKSKTAFYSINANPLIDLYKYNGIKTVKKCKICQREFVVHGNQKTCSDQCSKRLNLINKNGQII